MTLLKLLNFNKYHFIHKKLKIRLLLKKILICRRPKRFTSNATVVAVQFPFEYFFLSLLW